MGRFRDFLKRITGFYTPFGGFSGTPPPEKTIADNNKKQPSDRGRFSDGDWIAAGIVGPERAVSVLQRIVTSIKFRNHASRQNRIDKICSAVDKEISSLLRFYEDGGKKDEERCESCIAKINADVLDREINEYKWKLNQKPNTDPVDVLNGIIQDLKRTMKLS